MFVALSINERLLYAQTNVGKRAESCEAAITRGNVRSDTRGVRRLRDAPHSAPRADWSETILLNGPVSDTSLLLERYVCNRIIALYSSFYWRHVVTICCASVIIEFHCFDEIDDSKVRKHFVVHQAGSLSINEAAVVSHKSLSHTTHLFN